MTSTNGENPIYTAAIKAGHGTDGQRSLSSPVYRSSTFAFPDAASAHAIHEGHAPGFFYGRMGTPTQADLESALADLEGGEAALATSSGMAAISTALFTALEPGDHIVAPRALYASTRQLMVGLLGRFGVETTFIDGGDPGAWEGATRTETRVLYVETPANPTLDIIDIEAVASLGRDRGILTVADNTFATPFNQRPLELGIDLVVHSATKFLGGHGDLVAGCLVGSEDLIQAARSETLKLLGGVIAPDVAWLVLRGLQTLPVRMERHNANALAVAGFLEGHATVSAAHYPGLPSHPRHATARSQMSGFGGVLSFELEDGQAARTLIDRLDLCTLAVSLGDTRTLVQHSASMTHASMPTEALRQAGIRDGLIRLSVGLERPADIIADLERGLAAI